MAADGDTSLDLERDFRREVRKAYYRREEDFIKEGQSGEAALRAYNDYLEEVEDLIEKLLDKRTRAEAQAGERVADRCGVVCSRGCGLWLVRGGGCHLHAAWSLRNAAVVLRRN